jgi:hypothetical protein
MQKQRDGLIAFSATRRSGRIVGIGPSITVRDSALFSGAGRARQAKGKDAKPSQAKHKGKGKGKGKGC